MRVLLAGPDYEENLSIRYLSSSLREAGHDTILAAFNSSSDLLRVVGQAQDADIVGLSMCFQSRAREFLQLARVIKSVDPAKLVVAGGHYASCAAEALLTHHPELDVIVIHEGERTMVEIANALPHLRHGLPEIAGIAYRDGEQVRFTRERRTLDDLDIVPFPDRSGPIHSIGGIPTSYMMGSRGCYGSCAYCCITTLHHLAPGKRFRQRKAERIADEMAALYRERGTRQFVFHDDNFLVPSEAINHARISAFENALKARGIENIALVIKCRPADASRDVFRRLKDLGLVRVFFGIESATERGLRSLERVQSVDDSIRALETCAALDISAQFTLMMFNPDATLDTLRADLAFMHRFRGNPLNFCRAEIYAGTPLERRMIELGRARGDYLAREYSLADPVAARASKLALELFYNRCWSGGSLMQKSIGLDHMAAVVKRLYHGPRPAAASRRVANWLERVNLDTVDLLEEVIDLSARSAVDPDASLKRRLRSIAVREAKTRAEFLAEGEKLKTELESLPFADQRPAYAPLSLPPLARQAAAALLAIGIPASSACGQPQDQGSKTPAAPAANQPYYGISEMAAPPLQTPAQVPVAETSSLSGTVTDSTGAVVAKVNITIRNAETGVAVRTLKTNDLGQYEADNLPIGRYSVTAEMRSFKTTVLPGIDVKAGTSAHGDIRLEIGSFNNGGCCEYAAVPIQTQPEDWLNKKKPFWYVVGEGEDHGTFKGISNVVYGDLRMWLQIFEANRERLPYPRPIAAGTSVYIPPSKRVVPKLISKVLPAYPAEARQAHVSGDVLIDVMLKPDGSVDQVSLIDGPALLVDAATSAVKQWRYKPLVVNGAPVLKFVVVVSFSRHGKVH